MNVILSIPIQKLFMLAVILKVVSAFFGWYFQLQWSLGLVFPLTVMMGYIFLGLKRKNREVSDEKFADSCYYIGFIFTITSIVFSLFDLPHIGERIQDIAVRFGAAMVSTVLGLAVRVYLVSFRPEASDALQNTEDAVLDAAQKFQERLVMAYEKLGDFQNQVTTATEKSIEAVKIQAEKLTQDHSARMERVFVELNENNQKVVSQSVSAVDSASARMTQSVDVYAEGMKNNLQSLGDKVATFGESVTRRLETTTFPDDFFSARLAEPLDQLKAATSEVSKQVESAALGTTEAAAVLSTAISKLKIKATRAEESLETINRMTEAQQAIFDTSAAQLEEIKKLGELLSGIQQALQTTNGTVTDNVVSNKIVQSRVSEVVAAVETSQNSVAEAMSKFSSLLEADRGTTSALGRQVESAEAAAKDLTQELRSNTTVAQLLTAKIEADTSTKPQLIAVLGTLQEQQAKLAEVMLNLQGKADGVSTEVTSVVTHLASVARSLDALSSSVALTSTQNTSNASAQTSKLDSPTNS